MKTLFIVHGIGKYTDWTDPSDLKPDATWFNGVKDTLTAAAKRYPSLTRYTPLSQQLRVEPIYYDHVFENVILRWKQGAADIREGMTGRTISLVDDLLKAVDAFTDDNWSRTHLSDLLMYAFVPHVRDAVVNCVGDQIYAFLSKNPAKARGDWSIIGHSMGTSVVHDAVHLLVNNTLEFTKDDTWAGTVMMVSNTSALLRDRREGVMSPYRSDVRPQLSAGMSACDYYINVNHVWDLVGMPDKFDPLDAWIDLQTRKERFIDITANDARLRDPHDLTHYLENPEVHQPLFKALFGEDILRKSELDAAAADYRAKSDLAAVERVRKDLESMSLSKALNFQNNADVEKILEAFDSFFKYMKTLP